MLPQLLFVSRQYWVYIGQSGLLYLNTIESTLFVFDFESIPIPRKCGSFMTRFLLTI